MHRLLQRGERPLAPRLHARAVRARLGANVAFEAARVFREPIEHAPGLAAQIEFRRRSAGEFEQAHGEEGQRIPLRMHRPQRALVPGSLQLPVAPRERVAHVEGERMRRVAGQPIRVPALASRRREVRHRIGEPALRGKPHGASGKSHERDPVELLQLPVQFRRQQAGLGRQAAVRDRLEQSPAGFRSRRWPPIGVPSPPDRVEHTGEPCPEMLEVLNVPVVQRAGQQAFLVPHRVRQVGSALAGSHVVQQVREVQPLPAAEEVAEIVVVAAGRDLVVVAMAFETGREQFAAASAHAAGEQPVVEVQEGECVLAPAMPDYGLTERVEGVGQITQRRPLGPRAGSLPADGAALDLVHRVFDEMPDGVERTCEVVLAAFVHRPPRVAEQGADRHVGLALAGVEAPCGKGRGKIAARVREHPLAADQERKHGVAGVALIFLALHPTPPNRVGKTMRLLEQDQA